MYNLNRLLYVANEYGMVIKKVRVVDQERTYIERKVKRRRKEGRRGLSGISKDEVL